MVTEKEKELIAEAIDHMVARLTELGCDSVAVFTTLRCGRRTDTLCSFEGNYYARIGVVREWLNHERDTETIDAICGDDEEII